MISLRLPRSNFTTPSSLTYIFQRPYLLLVFLYFLVSSVDLIHLQFLVFKIKPTIVISIISFGACLSYYRSFAISTKYFVLSLCLVGSMIISSFNSYNVLACMGFTFFFLFSFFSYFVLPVNLFRRENPKIILEIYNASFYVVGFYALAQVVFSMRDITLFGASQNILGLVRGQALTFEPSFYALYMTPFVMFSISKYLLQDPSRRKLSSVILPNILFLASTSTGCFFSYLFFLVYFLGFKIFKILSKERVSVFGVINFFLGLFSASFLFLWATNSTLIFKGFLKFFYDMGLSHFSIWDRWRGLVEYWGIFFEHPLIGVGFGAGPFYLAWKAGYSISEMMDPVIVQDFAPMNVTTEILGSLGMLGGIFFLIFICFLINEFRSTLRISNLSDDERITVISLALSVCVMLSALQFNQSIMRAYLWIHLGVFCGYLKSLKFRI